MAELTALFLVGLSLFFHGVSGIRTQLQGLTSRRLRQQFTQWSQHPVLAGAWGFVFGAITQSSTAVAFIVGSLASGGFMTVARALPIIAWANLGTVALVFFVSFDVKLALLYVLGLSGLALAFDIGSARTKPALNVLFCVGLLFFGLHLMKDAFAPLPKFAWFKDVTAFLHGSALATFVAGALLRVLVQSSSGVAVIAIALAHGGLVTNEQAVLMVFGTGAGVGISVFLLSSNLNGVPRQIALYQALLNSATALLLSVLCAVELIAGWPLVLRLLQALSSDESLRLAWAFLLQQSLAVGIALVSSRQAARWLERLAPPTRGHELAQARYLNSQALADPESALDLAEKEQLRLFGHLTAQIDTIRAETTSVAALPSETWHKATLAVATEIDHFLHDIVDRQSDHATSERLIALQGRHALLLSLDETVTNFVATYAPLHAAGSAVNPFLDHLAESLATLVATTVDAVRSGDTTDLEVVLRMTTDRSDLMERLRRNQLEGAPALEHQQKAHLFYLTSLFERTVWLLRQLAQSAARGPGNATLPATDIQS